jgi:hypothetical protein
MISSEQRTYVRELAGRAAELANSGEYAARRKRWRDVNGLRRPDRAPVWAKPIGCWAELLSEGELRCADQPYRDMERLLRRWLIKHEIGDDSLIPPAFPVPAALEGVEPLWGLPIRRIQPSSPGGAWRFDPPVHQESDLDKLRVPQYRLDRQATRRNLQQHAEILAGVMPAAVIAELPLHLTLCTYAAELLGLDNMMLYLAAEPAMMHRLMGFLRDAVAAAMDQVQAMGVLSENNDQEMYCSDSLRSTSAGQSLTIADLWGQANSQEFQLVSPAMWEEFLLSYQRPLLDRFALTSYGCCEDLTHKLAGVLSVRNLRVFVCSAWTDLAKVVEAVGGRYTIMWRQKASDVVYGDLEATRRHLHEGMRLSQGCHRQIVLRELQTLAGDPKRLHKWSAMAKEAAEKHC